MTDMDRWEAMSTVSLPNRVTGGAIGCEVEIEVSASTDDSRDTARHLMREVEPAVAAELLAFEGVSDGS